MRVHWLNRFDDEAREFGYPPPRIGLELADELEAERRAMLSAETGTAPTKFGAQSARANRVIQPQDSRGARLRQRGGRIR